MTVTHDRVGRVGERSDTRSDPDSSSQVGDSSKRARFLVRLWSTLVDDPYRFVIVL